MHQWQQSRRALGSEVILTLVGPKTEIFYANVFKILWAQIDQFEQRFSRFLTDSELSKFNHRSGKRTEISTEFNELLKVSHKLSLASGGIYNPFVLPKLQAAGYIGSWPTPAKHQAGLDYRDRQVFKSDQLEIGDSWARIPANSALDFGGSGKGFLLDLLSNYLQAHATNNFWLSLGGDIICHGHDQDQQPWQVAIANAQENQAPVGVFTNTDGQTMAVATSGIIKRRGPEWHHIIDPRSGLPSKSDVLTASVKTIKAVEADVYAKCLVILGSDQLNDFAKNHHLLGALVQTDKNSVISYGDLT